LTDPSVLTPLFPIFLLLLLASALALVLLASAVALPFDVGVFLIVALDLLGLDLLLAIFLSFTSCIFKQVSTAVQDSAKIYSWSKLALIVQTFKFLFASFITNNVSAIKSLIFYFMSFS